ncbi:hypothetical protein FRC17_010775 [Serendipita sp. 399]|nr:hypothetical protein FRC17_010775 [Serendipita sp. 399]
MALRVSRMIPRSTIQAPRTKGIRNTLNFRFSSTSSGPTSSAGQQPVPQRGWSLMRFGFSVAKYTAFLIGSAGAGILLVGGTVFIHDAFTYSEKHLDRVPVSPLALNPKLGGPKNLPIAEVNLDDEENEGMLIPLEVYWEVLSYYGKPQISECIKMAGKPRLVIVGGGWGALGVLKTLNPGDYHVTVIAPETFSTFTPLLPSAAVGTVQVRSLVEPLRKIIARVRGHFLNGYAVDLVMGEQLLEVETVESDGTKKRLYVPYDKLVIAVGSVSSTHGVPGLEHCFQLKTISDSRSIRRRILDNFETASLPTTTSEERKRLLTFVICGGGPTGVETAAEIFDLCQEDIVNYFPKICRKEVSIYVIQSRDHILNTYSENISKYAEQRFNRDDIKVVTNARVKEVWKDRVVYTIKVEEKDKDGKTQKVTKEVAVPSNFVLWSTGIAMNPFTRRVSDLLPNQVHRKAIEVDAHLRVVGAPLGTVYALGDAATIETSVVAHILELVDQADRDKNGRIDYDEWKIMGKFIMFFLKRSHSIKKKIPMAGPHLEKVRDMFQRYDIDHDDSLSINEVATLLAELGNKITSLPATAQVASQQGKYLGHKLSKIARKEAVLAANGISTDVGDDVVSKPFHYRHLGSLAYIGNAAVFDFDGLSLMGGLIHNALNSSFLNGKMRDVSYRKEQLAKLAYLVKDNTAAICDALYADVNRVSTEVILSETSVVLAEVVNAYANVSSWAEDIKPPTGLNFRLMKLRIKPTPKGVVLIIAPFNFPLLLTFMPLIGALAAGCTVVLKISEGLPNTSPLIQKLIEEYLDPEVVRVVQGGVEETTKLLQLRWDHILFTGSARVGHIVSAAAAKYNTPITLELGGKCPTIIDPAYPDFSLIARRLAWGRNLNSGQSCTAPDFVLIPRSGQQRLIDELKKAYADFFPEEKSLPQLVSVDATNRIKGYLDETKGGIAIGGRVDISQRFISPTVVIDVDGTDATMQEEIFGPILSIVPAETLDEAIEFINSRPQPLAIYVFSEDETFKEKGALAQGQLFTMMSSFKREYLGFHLEALVNQDQYGNPKMGTSAELTRLLHVAVQTFGCGSFDSRFGAI